MQKVLEKDPLAFRCGFPMSLGPMGNPRLFRRMVRSARRAPGGMPAPALSRRAGLTAAPPGVGPANPAPPSGLAACHGLGGRMKPPATSRCAPAGAPVPAAGAIRSAGRGLLRVRGGGDGTGAAAGPVTAGAPGPRPDARGGGGGRPGVLLEKASSRGRAPWPRGGGGWCWPVRARGAGSIVDRSAGGNRPVRCAARGRR